MYFFFFFFFWLRKLPEYYLLAHGLILFKAFDGQNIIIWPKYNVGPKNNIPEVSLTKKKSKKKHESRKSPIPYYIVKCFVILICNARYINYIFIHAFFFPLWIKKKLVFPLFSVFFLGEKDYLCIIKILIVLWYKKKPYFNDQETR